MIGDAKAPEFETTWCVLVSLFVHLIESPVLIVTLAGVNAVAVMFTFLVTAVVAGCEAPVTTSAAAAIVAITNVRMNPNPLRYDGELCLSH
jgi:hypothetical protein